MTVKHKVRKFLDYDGPKFDKGVDCSVDRDTGTSALSNVDFKRLLPRFLR